MKAFAVLEETENTGGIFFAKHNVVARRNGAALLDSEFSYVTCRRAPWADAYFGRPIPVSVMIDAGWHFECHGCGARIDADWLDERRLSVEGVIGTQWSSVYCCARCKWQSMRREHRRKAEENRAIEAYKAIVKHRFPDAVFIESEAGKKLLGAHHAYVTEERGAWHWRQVSVSFAFPGMKLGPATYRLPDRPWRGTAPGSQFIGPIQPEYECYSGDREAFEAYAKATRKAQ